MLRALENAAGPALRKAPPEARHSATRGEFNIRGVGRYAYADGGGGAEAAVSATSSSAPSGPAAAQPMRSPVIVYASRTHSQLTQVVRELKKTAYRPRIAVLGSREQLCVHPSVSQLRGTQQNNACRALTAAHGCKYRLGIDRHLQLHGSTVGAPRLRAGGGAESGEAAAGAGGAGSEAEAVRLAREEAASFEARNHELLDIEDLARLGREEEVRERGGEG